MQSLIKHLLAVSEVGPALRQSLRAALASNDVTRLRAAGRTLVSTLIRRGDLVRVMVNGREGGGDRYFALRGHASLLDLSPLYDDDSTPGVENGQILIAPGNEEQPSIEADPLAELDLSVHDRVLSAMERAQDLNITRTSGNGDAGILQSLLDLLAPTLPTLVLHVELFKTADVPEPLQNIFRCPRDDRPFWALTRMEGEAVWIPEHRELPAFVRERIPLPGETNGFRAGVVVPLYAPAETETRTACEAIEAGLVYAVSSEPLDRNAFFRLANRLSRFVTHGWRQTRVMSRLVHTDNLTGVHNRAFFDEQFVLEIERARRRKAPLVLLIGDIDHFKDVNDAYGHPAGDRVLKSVARELLQGLRRIDLVCRVGGEEFALVLPDTDLDAARDIVTRIQVRIANLRMTDPGAAEPLRVTISFGGAAFPGAGETPDELYGIADRMLYLSKQRGRNRCHFWNPDGEPLLTLPRYSAPRD